MEALEPVLQVMGLHEEAIDYLKNVKGCNRVAHLVMYNDEELQQLIQESRGQVKQGDIETLRTYLYFICEPINECWGASSQLENCQKAIT